MKYIQQITEQLNKMSEEQKNQWILSQAKLCEEIERQGFLQTRLAFWGEYRTAADILDRVCRLEFEVMEAPDSDEYAEKEEGPFTLADAVKERMLSRQLAEIGLD